MVLLQGSAVQTLLGGSNVGFSLPSCSAHRSPFAAMGITPYYLLWALPRANSRAQLCLPPCKSTVGSSGPSVGDLGEGGSACTLHHAAPSQIHPGSDATGSDRGHGINVGNLFMKKESPTSSAAGQIGAWGGGAAPGDAAHRASAGAQTPLHCQPPAASPSGVEAPSSAARGPCLQHPIPQQGLSGPSSQSHMPKDGPSSLHRGSSGWEQQPNPRCRASLSSWQH